MNEKMVYIMETVKEVKESVQTIWQRLAGQGERIIKEEQKNESQQKDIDRHERKFDK